MPTESTIYQVLVAMPVDVEGEQRLMKDVLFEWNSVIGRKEDVFLRPIDASHVDLDRSSLADDVDIVLGTFWTTLDGTAGDLADAMIRLALGEDLPSILGFSEREIPPSQIDPGQHEDLQDFRKSCRRAGYFTFTNDEEYKKQLTQAVNRTMDCVLSPAEDSRTTSNEDEPSEYDPEVDHERLRLSSEIHREQDEQNIERIVKHFREQEFETPYRVLDVGCGYGTVTKSRFGNDDRFEVIAIDDTKSILDIAEKEYPAQNIDYRHIDVNELDHFGLGPYDLVFSSYLFHHIANQEAVLSLLWDRVREGGALAVRSCDDGQHLHYPPSEDMDFIVSVTDQIQGASDRTHGRRLPTHMGRLTPNPEDVWFDLENYHTVGRSGNERRDFWKVFHSNRLHYAKVRAERDDATREDKQSYHSLKDQMEIQKERIVENGDVLDAKSVPLAVAIK